MVGGELAVRIGYQGALGRPDLAHQGHEPGIVAHSRPLAVARPGKGITLDVEFDLEHRRQVVAVLGADMPLIGAGVACSVTEGLVVSREFLISAILLRLTDRAITAGIPA